MCSLGRPHCPLFSVTMAPLLPSSLYSVGLPLAALATQQRETQQAAVAYSVAERSLSNMAAAPAEKKIAMYSKARGRRRGLMHRGLAAGVWGAPRPTPAPGACPVDTAPRGEPG